MQKDNRPTTSFIYVMHGYALPFKPMIRKRVKLVRYCKSSLMRAHQHVPFYIRSLFRSATCYMQTAVIADFHHIRGFKHDTLFARLTETGVNRDRMSNIVVEEGPRIPKIQRKWGPPHQIVGET